MGTPGFIYVLINPSLEGLVKIGKTTRSPVNRVNKLSSATGVPTPFQLVYWAEFSDCDSAERVLHNILTERGARVSDNREFFRVQTHEAITAVLSLQQGVLSPEYTTQPAQGYKEPEQTSSASLIDSLFMDAYEHLMKLEITKVPLIMLSYCKNGGAAYEDNDLGTEWGVHRNSGLDFAFG